jgi:hypothetical protein
VPAGLIEDQKDAFVRAGAPTSWANYSPRAIENSSLLTAWAGSATTPLRLWAVRSHIGRSTRTPARAWLWASDRPAPIPYASLA